MRKVFWEAMAFLAFLFLALVGTPAVLSLATKPEPTPAVVWIEAPLGKPVICDATVQQCGSTLNCKKPKCYVRSGR